MDDGSSFMFALDVIARLTLIGIGIRVSIDMIKDTLEISKRRLSDSAAEEVGEE